MTWLSLSNILEQPVILRDAFYQNIFIYIELKYFQNDLVNHVPINCTVFSDAPILTILSQHTSNSEPHNVQI